MNLYFPQWHGGAEVSRTLLGSTKLREQLSGVPFVDVPVSGAQGLPIVDDIKAKPFLLENLRALSSILELHKPERLNVLGGDCGVAFVPITYLNAIHADEVAVIWLDAHADINTPASSPSKHFHGMVLRAALGETDAEFLSFAARPIRPDQVFLAGVRDLDAPELDFVEQAGIRRFDSSTLNAKPETLVQAVLEAGFNKVNVHLDFDAFDPNDLDLTRFPTPNGLTLETVIHVLEHTQTELELVGLTLTECGPKDEAHWGANVGKLERLLRATPFLR